MNFGKSSPSTRPSTVFLGVTAFVRHLNHRHPTPMRRSVSNTCCPLRCCIFDAASPPHPPLSLAHFHESMLLSSLLWVLYFEFQFLFPIFLRVPSAVCNYLIYMVWGGFWTYMVLFSSLDHLVVPSLTHHVLLPSMAANFLGLRTKKA